MWSRGGKAPKLSRRVEVKVGHALYSSGDLASPKLQFVMWPIRQAPLHSLFPPASRASDRAQGLTLWGINGAWALGSLCVICYRPPGTAGTGTLRCHYRGQALHVTEATRGPWANSRRVRQSLRYTYSWCMVIFRRNGPMRRPVFNLIVTPRVIRCLATMTTRKTPLVAIWGSTGTGKSEVSE